jgi:hypothetical protein
MDLGRPKREVRYGWEMQILGGKRIYLGDHAPPKSRPNCAVFLRREAITAA